MKFFRVFRLFEYSLWQKTKTWKCRKSIASFLNQKTPSSDALPLLGTAKKISIYCLNTILTIITEKVTFKLQQKVLLNDFEQHFQSCILNARDTYESAENQINSLNALKKELIKNFPWFLGFRKCTMAKNEILDMPGINRGLSKLQNILY